MWDPGSVQPAGVKEKVILGGGEWDGGSRGLGGAEARTGVNPQPKHQFTDQHGNRADVLQWQHLAAVWVVSLLGDGFRFNPRGNGRPCRPEGGCLVSCLCCLSFQESKFKSKYSPWREGLRHDLHARGNVRHAVSVWCHHWADKANVRTRMDLTMCRQPFCLYINKEHGFNPCTWIKIVILETISVSDITLGSWFLIFNINSCL